MKPICRTYSSLFLALTATRLKPTRPNNEVCSRFVLNSWLCQVLRSLASVGKGTAFHMGIAHTGAGQHPVTDSQRFNRSEEHTSELQSLMRISYAVFCLTKQKRCIITIH